MLKQAVFRKLVSLLLSLTAILSLICIPALATEDSDAYVRSVLKGKRILFLGDSYTGGRGIDNYADTWCARLETEYGMDVTCNSINGSTMGATPYFGYLPGCCYFPICFRPMPEEDFDLIFISAGSNDWNLELPIGTDPESRDVTTFMGAINVIIDRVGFEHPEATLIMMTPWVSDGRETSRGETTDDYARAMTDICASREISCLRVCDPWVSEIFADHAGFREDYFLSDSDPWHLNKDGHDRFLPIIASWIAKLYLVDATMEQGGSLEEYLRIEELIPAPWTKLMEASLSQP